ncbi:secreted RxLR effector protein 161-like [Solenopsis invicta]|uniref:secreted RxLR effector protein 161-like n=1 Tax=Solenopsis invicta TaxID=13686 RepID=UPI00193CFD85|nr:secreted RxLR effector protein 161-like [Solenopsis invicta]
MIDAKLMSVPSDPNVILYPVLKEKVAVKVPFREAVGSLIFLAIVCRPDIAFAVNSVSKFLNNYSNDHWRTVKQILAYVSGTLEYGIEFRGGGSVLELTGYSDADYAGDIETQRSTTGYIFELAGGPVTWASQRQK